MLEAYVSGKLSPAAQAQVEAHVKASVSGRDALHAIREYNVFLVEENARLEERVANVNFDAIEDKLFLQLSSASPVEPPTHQLAVEFKSPPSATAHSIRKFAPAFAATMLAAAACVVGFVVLGKKLSPVIKSPPVAVHMPQNVSGLKPDTFAMVTAVMGQPLVRNIETGLMRPLKAGDTLRQGDTLLTQAHEAVYVRHDLKSSFAIDELTSLQIKTLTLKDTWLYLEKGSVSSQVRPLDARATYKVSTDLHHAHVKGTWFSATKTDKGATSVQVKEGHVIVKDTMDVELAVLIALPEKVARWSSVEDAGFGPVFGPAPWSTEWKVIQHQPVLIDWNGLFEMVVDGMGFPKTDKHFEALLSRGKHTLKLTDRFGRNFFAEIEVGEGPVALSLQDWEKELVEGTMDPSLLRAAIQSQKRSLQQCWDAHIKSQPRTPSAQLRIRFQIGINGELSRIRLNGEAPANLEACLIGKMEAMIFPAPVGGPMGFEIPLNFRNSAVDPNP